MFLALAGPAIRWLRMRRRRDSTEVPQLQYLAPGEGEDHRQLPQLRRPLRP